MVGIGGGRDKDHRKPSHRNKIYGWFTVVFLRPYMLQRFQDKAVCLVYN